MSNQHTRKTFFAKAIAAVAGLGLLGGARLAAKPASGAKPTSAGETPNTAFTVQVDSRSVARSVDSL